MVDVGHLRLSVMVDIVYYKTGDDITRVLVLRMNITTCCNFIFDMFRCVGSSVGFFFALVSNSNAVYKDSLYF